jgi:hypothetical protein
MTTTKTELSEIERRKILEALRKKLEAFTGHQRSDTTGPYINRCLSLMEEENINDDSEHP